MATWNVKENLGTSYIYCSKNATNDIAASAFFGKAPAWVSGAAVTINQRVISVSIQYYNKTGTNTTTAPASDSTNWGIDKSNFQQYLPAQTYTTGDKCVNTTHHWICNTTGVTGTFDPTKWTDTIISNSSTPYKLMNTAIVMQNADARFVSSEVLDTVNNIATQLIWIVLSNGIWNETLTLPTKFIRVVGQSNQKTQLNGGYQSSNAFLDTIQIYYGNYNDQNIFKGQNCFYNIIAQTQGGSSMWVYFSYKNIFLNYGTINNTVGIIYHMVSCTILSWSQAAVSISYVNTSVFRNNYIKGTTIELGLISNGVNGLNQLQVGNFDYNCYDGTVKLNGVTQTTITTLRTSVPNQNNNSFYGSMTLNIDNTLQAGSALVGVGSNGNNIGSEGVGYINNINDIWNTGATYKNIIKNGTTLIRDQISKIAQSGTTNTITLISTASSIDNTYNNFRIFISAGTGVGQTKTITSYVGSTKVATISGQTWSPVPDTTSVYEILDGSVTSMIGDLGSIQTVKKLNFTVGNVYDVTGLILSQTVSQTDARLDNPAALTFDLTANNNSGLVGASTYRFVQDDFLKIDNVGKGCGDSSYSPSNLLTSTLTFRYYQIKLNFQK